MIMIRGFIEMLEMADTHGAKTFNDFTRISIGRRRLSSATISKRLKEMTDTGVLEEVITRSKLGRRVIAYRTTEKGKKVVSLAKELEQTLATPKGR